MNLKNLVMVLTACVLAMAGCSNQREGITPRTEVQAPALVSRSFLAIQNDAWAADRFHLAIRKEALEKEFLLHANLIPQNGAATSEGLQGRVVAFRRIDDKVFLLEATQGHVVTGDLPATLILAEIPIVRETPDTIELDFNAGMQKVFVTGNWYGSESGETDYRPPVDAVSVEHSFIDTIREIDNQIEIRQIAQLAASGSSFPTYEIRYFLTPYSPNPTFEPKESGDFRHVGFFEVPPILEATTGRSIIRISRWDHRRPIIFHVSANTPAEYVQAVREGILYWNHAFGAEIVRAETAPAGATAPDVQYNVIQWVPNDDAGFAYADALMDPRSGEILHAQVYQTSVFAVSSKARVPAILRRLRATADSGEAGGKRLGIKFLRGGRLCDHDLTARMANALAASLEHLSAIGAEDATYLRLSQDYVREVVAHEVGHTLGMRHNFAGSMGTEFASLAQRDEAYRRYVTLKELPIRRSSSSVMEYETFEDSIITGAQMKAELPALSYDAMAIQWAYNGKAYDARTAPLFCTDSHTLLFADCVRFDTGTRPLEYLDYALRTALDRLPYGLVETFLRAKAPMDPRDRLPFEEVAINPVAMALTFAGYLGDAASWLGTPAPRSLAIERQFPFVNPINQDEVQTRYQGWMDEQIRSLGGVDALLFSLLPQTDRAAAPIARVALEKLNVFLERPEVRDGIGYDGRPYHLSDSEVGLIRAVGAKAFAQVEALLLERALDELGAVRYALPGASDEVEARLASTAMTIVLAQTERDVDGSQGKVKAFAHPRALRVKAARLLASKLGTSVDWSLVAREELKLRLKDIVEKSLGQPLSKIDELQLPRPLRQWFLEQTMLIGLLNQL